VPRRREKGLPLDSHRWTRARARWAALGAACLTIAIALAALLGTSVADAPPDFAAPAALSTAAAHDLGERQGNSAPGGGDRSDGSELPAQAQQLVGDTFGDELREPATPLELPPGGEVEQYIGDHAARVELADGGQQLALSALPLRVETATGEPAPVDLSLEHDGTELVPENPVVDVSVPHELEAGAAIGDDGLRLAPATGSATASAQLTDNKAFYAEVAHDTDWLVGPVPTGAEFLLQLRSAESPERHAVEVSLPAGASLRAAADGGVEVVRDGEVLARVRPPAAADADGTAVPVSYEIGADGFTVVVGHHGRDLAYPVLVDPVVEDWATDGQGHYVDGWFQNPTLDQLGWEFSANPGGSFQGARQGGSIVSYGTPPGRGLYVLAPPSTQRQLGDYGYWSWHAPGQTAFVTRAEFRTISFEPRNGPSIPAAVAGLWNSQRGAFSGLRVSPWRLTGANTTVAPGDNVIGADSRATDTAIFGMGMLGTNHGPSWITAYLGGAVIYLDDPEPASVRVVDAPSGWVGPGGGPTIEGTDPGLGVKSLRLSGAGAPVDRVHPCLGDRLSRCPASWSQRFDAATLPEGSSTLQASAVDVLGKRSTLKPVAVKVDRSGPQLAVTGELRAAAGTFLADRPYAVHAVATDGTAAAPRSGVRSLELLVDGGRREFADQTCAAGNCSLTRDFQLDASTLGEGDRQVVLRATDVVGNVSQQQWTVRIDRTAPTVALAGGLWDGRDGWVDGGQLPLHVAATDAGSGVASAELVVDGIRRELSSAPACPAGDCGLVADWTLNAAALDPGEHLVQVLVLDRVGRLHQDSWTLRVDHADPLLELTGALADADGGEIGADATLHVHAADAASGVTAVKIELDGAQAELRQQACAAGGCGLDLDWTLAVDGLAEGPHTVGVRATDAVGRVTTRELRFDLHTDDTPAAPALDPTEITPFEQQTSFLYQSAHPVQTGVAAGTIEETRAAVIRGKVSLWDDAPLAGVTASVIDHPEYGQTLTRADGEIYLAVNGGGPLTVRLERDGYLPVDRQVEVPWQGYAQLDPVVMIEQDPHVSEIAVGDPLTPLQVHRGSRIDDGAGERQATLVFPAGLEATMELPDGTTQPLWDMHVRATEYTVGAAGPAAMPAPLPPTSAYTYAADFSVDEARAAGAKHVDFSKPVIGYLENFRHAPVGHRVPNGYYERETGQWVPDSDGRVVKVLSEAGGVAALDVTGSGQAADAAALSALGIDAAELHKVAELYAPGQELWRVPMRHFSDWNFGFVLIGAVLKPADWLVDRLQEHFCGSSGSVIECENQTLGEDLPVTGSGIALHYRSDRVPGRRQDRYAIDIPLIDGDVPAGLMGIDVQVEVAGRLFSHVGGDRFAPEPNQTYHFEWDGKDAFGRTLQGAQKAHIRVGYAYRIQYDSDPVSPDDQSKGFGVPPRGSAWSYFSIAVGGSSGGGAAQASQPAEQPTVTVWRDVDTTVGGFDARAAELGGWTLSPHHQYDPVAKVLYRGDGTRQGSESVNREIERFAGVNNEPGQGGDGGAATNARLNGPGGMDVGPDGSVYVAEFYNDTIRRIWPDGTITRVAGIPREHFDQPWQLSGDGGPALAARLGSPTDVDVGPDGSLYITDYGNQRIRRVDPDGIISTVAGGGSAYNVDDVPATQASLNFPQATEVAPDGTLYIGDRSGRVKRVGPDGRIVTYAGGGNSDQNDVQATQGLILGIQDLALAPDGTLYIAESSFFTGIVFRVTPEGLIRRVAGDRQNFGDVEDRMTVPALEARIDAHRVAVAPDGSVHIGDRMNHKVWRLDPDGMLRVELGGGYAGGGDANGDGGPVRLAKASTPMNMTFAPDGSMFLADYGYETIRRIGETMSGFTGEDLALPSADSSELYRFDETGRHLETRSTATGQLLDGFHYDGAGRLSSIEDGDGNELSIERDGAGKPTALVAPFGQRTELSVNADGWLTGVRDPASRDTTLAYGTGGLLSLFALPGGRVSDFSYDAGGRLTRDDNADGGFKTLARTDARHSLDVTLDTKLGRSSNHHVELLEDGSMERTVSDPAGVETRTRESRADGERTVERGDGTRVSRRLAPDPRFGMTAGYVGQATVERPSGARLSVLNDRDVELANPDDVLSLNRLVDSSTVAGRTISSTWDRAAGTLTTRFPSQRTAVTTFDGQGRVTLDHAPGVHDVAYDYDGHGRLSAVTQGTRSAQFGYDAAGWLASITDPLGRETQLTRDALGRVTAETLPGGRQVGYQYDAAGNLASITPPSRPSHGFSHSLTGLRTAWTPPLVADAGATTFDYDDDQGIAAVHRPDGSEIAVERDDAGRPTAIEHPDGRVQMTYDPDGGQPASVAVPGGQSIGWQYDGSLATSETATGEIAGEVGQQRDGEGRLETSTLTGTPAVGYDYDGGGLLRQVGPLSLTRNAATGFLSGTELGELTTGVDYDGYGDVASLTAAYRGSELFSESVQRDDGARIVAQTETVDGAASHQRAYAYDAAGRLETVSQDGQLAVSYEYDANGNRVAEHPAGEPAISADFDDQDRVLRQGTVDYDWTAAGELRSRTDTSTDETTTYAYDALGGLRHVELPDGHEIDYVLDGLGRRVGRKLDGDLQYGFLYGETSRPSAELAPDGSIRTRFVYGTRSTVPDYMQRGGHIYRFVTDHLGSPRLVVDTSTGSIAQKLSYDAFGRVTEDTNPGFQPFGYAGGLYDPDTGLVRFGARDYDPETGRWTTKDPLDFDAGDTNLYAYAFADPINLTDPSGQIVDTIVDASFIAYDAATLALGCGSWSSLGMDAIGLAIPLVTGLGHADDVARIAGKGPAPTASSAFDVAPRVADQLVDPRLDSLAGRLTSDELQRLVNAPSARRYYDATTNHINVIQEVDGRLLRITTMSDSMTIISVGPIRSRGVENGVRRGRYVPLP
jgi:RHS repeat-associated protein